MRASGFVAAIAALTASVPAHAAWMEYKYPELGFVVQFPDAPSPATGTYNTTLVTNAPVHNYVLKQDDGVFTATAVDMLDAKEDGARILIEAEYQLQYLGDLVASPISRVETGKDSVYGHFLTINCRPDREPETPGAVESAHKWYKDLGVAECPKGARLTVNLFFLRGRLYMLQGMTPPREGGGFGPTALRFANSVSFYRADGTRNPADGSQ